jgi:hypothetical protein
MHNPSSFSLIVIRVVPQAPTDPNRFTTYLGAMGGLQITANDLSFNNPQPGQNVESTTSQLTTPINAQTISDGERNGSKIEPISE